MNYLNVDNKLNYFNTLDINKNTICIYMYLIKYSSYICNLYKKGNYFLNRIDISFTYT